MKITIEVSTSCSCELELENCKIHQIKLILHSMVTQGSIFVLPAFAIASFSCKVAFLVCESLKEVGYLFAELKNIELTQSKALIFSSSCSLSWDPI